jgi:hypothetical protein
VTAKLELVLVTDQLAGSIEDLNHNNVFNSEESNMSKKMEDIEPIPLQPVHEISKTKEQIKKPLVIDDTQVEFLNFFDLKPKDVHKEEFLDLSQERESMKFRKLHFISDNVEIKEGIDKSMKEQEIMKKISHSNGLYCDANEVFDENLERKEFLGRVKKIWVCPLTRTEWSRGVL